MTYRMGIALASLANALVAVYLHLWKLGVVGTLSLVVMAPVLAEFALGFSPYEYFWLALLGLMCATLVARSSPVKAIAAISAP